MLSRRQALIASTPLPLVWLSGRLGWSAPRPERGPLRVGAKAPHFRLRTLDNVPFKLEELLGKPLLIDFFRTDCYPCRRAVPELIRLHQRYSPAGVRVVLIALIERERNGEARLTEFLSKHRLPFLVLKDPNEYYSEMFLGPLGSLPATFLLDGSGKVIHRQFGASAEDSFGDFERILDERERKPRQKRK